MTSFLSHDEKESNNFSVKSGAPVDSDYGPVPLPGPAAGIIVVIAIAVGLIVAVGFEALSPDSKFVILGGTILCAALLGILGLYRYRWFLMTVLAIRPSLDDLIADEFGTFQPSAIMGIVVIGVTTLHLFGLRSAGRWHPVSPMGLAFVGFFVGFLPSFVTSVDRGVSQAALFGVASVVVLYLAIEQQLRQDRAVIYQLLGASAVGLIVPYTVGYVQFFWTGTLDPGGSGLVRIDGSFAHPNTYATYLCFSLILMLSVMPSLPVKPRLGILIASLTGGFLLVASFARGAWASFLLGSLLLAARVNKRFVGVIMGAAVLAAVAVPGVGERLANLTASSGPGGTVKTDDSLAWRIGYWGKVSGFFTDRPVTGVGIDATKTLTIEAKDPHNSFLQAFVEGGVFGGGAFLLLLGVACVAALRVWRRARDGEFDQRTSLVAAGCIAALFSVATQLITENVLFNTIIWWYVNIALAFLAVLTWSRVAVTPVPVEVARLELPEAGQTSVAELEPPTDDPYEETMNDELVDTTVHGGPA